MLDVSAVICTLNSERNIQKCLDSLRINLVKEIIIVDGGSTDSTLVIVAGKVNKVLYDRRTGLADARNLGIKEANCKYILNVGSDNYFPKNSIRDLIQFYEKNCYKGVSMLTNVDFTNNQYLAYCMNLHRQLRFKPGPSRVIGTPTLFESWLLKENLFLSSASNSDDEELCNRLNSKYGYNFGISDIYCHESSSDFLSEVHDKWARYGISDHEIFSRNRKEWSRKRRLKSLLHPFTVELLVPVFRSPKALLILPFLFYVTVVRYFSWLRRSINDL